MVEKENTLSSDLQMLSPNKYFFFKFKLPGSSRVSVDRVPLFVPAVLEAGNPRDEAS